MNKQREAVYGLRRQLMEGVDQKQLITDDYVSTILSNILEENAPEKAHPDEWNYGAIFTQIFDTFGSNLNEGPDAIDIHSLNRHELGETIFERLRTRYDLKEQILGAQAMRYHERIVMLSVLDGLWKDHLLAMDHLKEGIGLRGYAQQDPLVAYKKESFEMFETMMLQFQQDTARHLFRMQIIGPDGQPIETVEQMQRAQAVVQAQMQAQQVRPASLPTLPAGPPSTQRRAPAEQGTLPMELDGNTAQPPQAAVPIPRRAQSTTIDELEREFQRKKKRELEHAHAASAGSGTNGNSPRVTGEKVGRNDPCPCGSGKKFKKCHGAQA
jgi:preprotein translocase subunit SecA